MTEPGPEESIAGLSAARWQAADDLLAATLERPPAERPAFLAAAEDGAAAEVVRGLLALEPHAPAFLERGAMEHALSFLSRVEEERTGSLAPGDRRRRLPDRAGDRPRRHERGVPAERDDGRFQKRVAVKVLPVLSNLLPRHFRRRFQSEREILAHLEHPAIARLLDGGETDDGEPYLVMEYVEGEPIDVYCNRRRLSIEERIALFLARRGGRLRPPEPRRPPRHQADQRAGLVGGRGEAARFRHRQGAVGGQRRRPAHRDRRAR
jgi:serine/threonine protein kinase